MHNTALSKPLGCSSQLAKELLGKRFIGEKRLTGINFNRLVSWLTTIDIHQLTIILYH